MHSPSKLKIAWTRDEWQQSRKGRRAVTDLITPASVRRRRSSSDKRLHAAFGRRRGPDFDER